MLDSQPVRITEVLDGWCGIGYTEPVGYAFCNLYYEPWSRKAIKCFDFKVINVVFL